MATIASQQLLEQRHQRKKRKPWFVVKESFHVARIAARWRFPRGVHSGVRQMHKGKPALPNPGYGSPKIVYGLTKKGFKPILVHTLEKLHSLNPQYDGAIIAATVGMRKKLQLLREAQKKNITILNISNSDKKIDALTTDFETRRKLRKEKLVSKDKKEEEKKKKAEEKKKKDEEQKKKEKSLSEKEKVKKEEEEHKKEQELAEKTLIKRQ